MKLAFSETPKTDFLTTRPICFCISVRSDDIATLFIFQMQEKAREPTFEGMLKAAIADVLNEYSDRNRRSVQNFTDQQVHVTRTSFTDDSATISLAVNSTKQGRHCCKSGNFLMGFIFAKLRICEVS